MQNKPDDKQETLWAAAWKAIAQKDHGGSSISKYVDELERELAMMTEAHETCKRCFAEAEAALSARTETLMKALEDIASGELGINISIKVAKQALSQYIGEKK